MHICQVKQRVISMCKYLWLMAPMALISAAAQSATFVKSVPGAPDPSDIGGLTIDFESSDLQEGIAFTSGSTFGILQGFVAHRGYAPAGDLSHYLSVPGSGVSGTAVMDFSAYKGPRLGDFSLYWGSIDAANSLTITTSLGAINILGSTLIPKGYGSMTSARGNRRVYFSLAPEEKLKSLTFSSPTAFEVDDIVFQRAMPSGVPEPSEWGDDGRRTRLCRSVRSLETKYPPANRVVQRMMD